MIRRIKQAMAIAISTVSGAELGLYAGRTVAVPYYLEKYYWWAYVRPWAVWIFDRLWVVNLILYGHYSMLRDLVLRELGSGLSGKTLQVACCYGDLTPRLAKRVAENGGSLDVIDVLPIQLQALRRKLEVGAPVRLMTMGATHLEMPDRDYDCVLLFFLLHEQPQEYRTRTMQEALRVLKPSGKIVIVDFGKFVWWHPLRFLWFPILRRLKPFIADFWNNELAELMPHQMSERVWRKTSYFGGIFQLLVSDREG